MNVLLFSIIFASFANLAFSFSGKNLKSFIKLRYQEFMISF
jgi:hypothetical protein